MYTMIVRPYNTKRASQPPIPYKARQTNPNTVDVTHIDCPYCGYYHKWTHTEEFIQTHRPGVSRALICEHCGREAHDYKHSKKFMREYAKKYV